MPGGVSITFSFPANLTPSEFEIIATTMARLFAAQGGQASWTFSVDSDPKQVYELGGLTYTELKRILGRDHTRAAPKPSAAKPTKRKTDKKGK